MAIQAEYGGFGTRMRALLDEMEQEIAHVYRDAGIPEYRPRFSPILQALVGRGPSSIRDLARAVGVTHSAASQTVAQMESAGFVSRRPGGDARNRIVTLTPRAEAILPVVTAEWAATAAAMASIDRELSTPLAATLDQLATALDRQSFGERIRFAGTDQAMRKSASFDSETE